MQMPLPRQDQLAFWQRREAEEIAIAATATGEAQIAHTELARSYAALIAQATREEPRAI